MATKKRTTTKKKPIARKAVSKKTTARRDSSKYQTFRLAKPSTPFFTVAITRQTLYWSIVGVAILALGFWVIHLQNKVNELYDTIEANNFSSDIYNYNTPVNKEAAKRN